MAAPIETRESIFRPSRIVLCLVFSTGLNRRVVSEAREDQNKVVLSNKNKNNYTELEYR